MTMGLKPLTTETCARAIVSYLQACQDDSYEEQVEAVDKMLIKVLPRIKKPAPDLSPESEAG